MSQGPILRIVVASPCDVPAERKVVPLVIEELNRHVAAALGLRLETFLWETDAHPGFHPEGPEGLIDRLMRIENCAVLIGIFWKRFGTPTGDAGSGTEHEFWRAYRSWQDQRRPEIMVYFNHTPYYPRDRAELKQWDQVFEFRERFPQEGLCWAYSGSIEFERLVRNHLTTFLLKSYAFRQVHDMETFDVSESREATLPDGSPSTITSILTGQEPPLRGSRDSPEGPAFRSDAWYLPDETLLGFVEVPSGSFLMGSNKNQDADTRDAELPQHPVTLPAYYMARYPVTVAQFRAFQQASGYEAMGRISPSEPGNHPVVDVTWHDALAYCNWLTIQLREWAHTPEPLAGLLREEGWQVSLPSEAEWEKAARGSDGWIYPWGNAFDRTRANADETGIGGTSAVGAFPSGASPYDCLDLAGNVWEWTRSLWGEDPSRPRFRYPYNVEDGREYLAASDNVLRVLRGGAFFLNSYSLRCAFRFWYYPSSFNGGIGFRVLVTPGAFESDSAGSESPMEAEGSAGGPH